MIYKKFYFNLVIRILLIALLSLFLSWIFLRNGINLTLLVGAVFYIIIIINLLYYVNRANHSLAYFFDAVQNEDSTLVFNEKTGLKSFNSLHRSLNLLNKKLQDARIDITVQEKYYMAIVESASTSILVSDNAGNIHLSNSALNKLLGIDTLHNINQINRICPSLKELIMEIKDGESRSLSTLIGGSPRYLHATSSSMLLRENKVKLVALHDISYELDKQEIESWQKLIRILNHEIMNSVAPITSLSATLSNFFRKKETPLQPSEIDEKTISNTIKGLSIIEEHGKGLISFIESYRSLTKLPRPEPADIKVSELFDSISILASSLVKEYRKKTGKVVDILYQAHPADLKIFVDKELFSRVILNLLKNAIEAFSKDDEAAVFLEAGLNKAGKAWIRVTDNGPGIPDDIIGNIFVPFFTTKEKGSGIGLSLSKQIVNMHKGTLNVFSNPGEGTTFVIRL
ncbi:MAG: ATP-binding protein [Marinilabiliaceae bacterium]|jgi:nitrogen fixation/metabolism regulation signal transduction histidine kinase|nr:ATP-binding protein [Marinilabiliaceae bacterium]